MADEYSFNPVVYRSIPGGLGSNHDIRSSIFGGLQYRPVTGTPLGRVVSQHAIMWNMHASGLAPHLLHRQGGSQGWGQGFYYGVNPLIHGQALPNRSSSILPGWAQGQIYRGVFNEPPPNPDPNPVPNPVPEPQYEPHPEPEPPIEPGPQPEPEPSGNPDGQSPVPPETLTDPAEDEEPFVYNFKYPTNSTVMVRQRSEWDEDFDSRLDKDDLFVRLSRESLFRDIREYLEKPYAEGDMMVTIHAECPMCSKQLEFFPPQESTRRIRGNITGNERMEVLPCGHIVGQDCMYAHRAKCLADGTRIQCPVCELPLTYRARSCAHPVSTYVVDRYTHFPPMTLAEGGRIPARCAACRPDGLDPKVDWSWIEEPPPPLPLFDRPYTNIPTPANAYNEVFFDD
ncbi:hypothetical protein F4811DRAFT_468191 [Daldinia bambusicola]|nr:hypothetical protein F4811DRAFT_468191 [Daldinia bambusicola]